MISLLISSPIELEYIFSDNYARKTRKRAIDLPTVAIVTIAKYREVMYRLQRSISLKCE